MPSKTISKNNKIGICLIGLGNFGKLIAGKLDKIENCVLKYGYHSDSEKARQWDEKRGISNLKKAFADPEVKAAVLTTPNHIRLEYIKQILDHEKHLYVAKPLAHTLEVGMKIEKLSKLHPELKIVVGHNFRRGVAIRQAKAMLDNNKIGKIINITINYSHGGIYGAAGKNEWKWRLNADTHLEGPLMTVGIHLIDILHYLFGEISEVYCVLQNISEIGTAPDCNVVLMRLRNNKATVFLQTNYNMPSERFITIYGTEGTIYINREEISLRLGIDKDRVPGLPQKISIPANDPVKEELEEFIDSIISGRKIETGIKEGLSALTVVDACLRSSHLKNPVSLSDYISEKI